MNILVLSALVTVCLADHPSSRRSGYSHFQPASHFDVTAQSASQPAPRPSFSASQPAPRPFFSASQPAPQPFFSASRPTPRPSFSASRPAPRPSFSASRPAPRPSFSASQPAPRPSFSASRPAPRPSFSASRPAPQHTYSAPKPSYSAPKKIVPILVDERVQPEGGSYSFNVETGDGVKRQENARTVYSEEGPVSAISGSYSFTLPNGQLFTMTYVADENGFQPVSSFLPVAPAFPHPIPAHALEQIEKARLEDEARARKHQGYGAPAPPSTGYGVNF